MPAFTGLSALSLTRQEYLDLFDLETCQMHYRNGREAKNGDRVVKLNNNGEIDAFGVLYSARPGNDYCNGSIAPITHDTGACLCDMLHVEDLAAILKLKGLDKRPAGK